jgi:hypothetical protein
MNKLAQTRATLFLIGILIVPFTFYWAYGNFSIAYDGLAALNTTFDYISSETIIAYSALAYLSVFFAFLIKKNVNLRVFLLLISALFELMMILEFSRTLLADQQLSTLKTLETVFFRSQDVVPLQAFNSLALILWSVLVYQERSWIPNQFRKIVISVKSGIDENQKLSVFIKNKFAILILVITVATAVTSGISSYKTYRSAAKQFDVGFQFELFLIVINLCLLVLVKTALVLLPLLFLFDTKESWLSEIKLITSSLMDFKLSRYLTRVISGYLYWFYTVCVVAILGLAAPLLTVVTYLETAAGYDSGFQPQLLLMILGIPVLFVVIGYFIILILRVVFELAVALIHIAENSRVKI